MRRRPAGELLLDLGRGGQLALNEIVEGLSDVLDYDADGVAGRWWPFGRGRAIVLDPRQGFGAPVVSGTRISAELLHDQGAVRRACRARGALTAGAVSDVAWSARGRPCA